MDKIDICPIRVDRIGLDVFTFPTVSALCGHGSGCEPSPPVWESCLMLEDGGYLLYEDGGKMELENNY